MKLTIFLLALFLFLWCSTSQAASGKLIIPGTGDSQTILSILAKKFEDINPAATIEIPDSIGSSGGIKMLNAQKCVLARIARPLQKDELNSQLTTLTFALSPIVFVVNPKIANLTEISTEQIRGIYRGTIKQWQDLGVNLDTIYPLTREEGDSSLLVLNRHIQDFATINAQKAKILYTTPATVEVLLRYQRTFGFIPIADAINKGLRILKIDGIAPTPENVQSGLYKFAAPLSFVYKEKEGPSELGQAFIDFIFSQEGKSIIYANGIIPATL